MISDRFERLLYFCLYYLQTVQPEDLTNQTRVLESIERVLESLTDKTSNWTDCITPHIIIICWVLFWMHLHLPTPSRNWTIILLNWIWDKVSYTCPVFLYKKHWCNYLNVWLYIMWCFEKISRAVDYCCCYCMWIMVQLCVYM